jgi:hypothetical protein
MSKVVPDGGGAPSVETSTSAPDAPEGKGGGHEQRLSISSTLTGSAKLQALKRKAQLRAYQKHKMTLRGRIWETLEDPGYSRLAKYYSIFMILLIVVATTCFVLESEATVTDGVLYGTNAADTFKTIELISVVLFTVEYLVRFSCSPCTRSFSALRFVFKMENLIDLFACLPYWVTLIIESMNPSLSTRGFGFVRVVRLVRVARIFKIGKYSVGIQMFTGAIARSTQPLSILLFLLVLAVILLSSVMFLFEGSVDPTSALFAASGVDPATHHFCFGTIPRTFWWSFVTMTTVGYGDCYPITVAGKLLAMATMLLGVFIFALPITVIGSNFQAMVDLFEEETATLNEFDTSDDGLIDIEELRKYIFAKKKEKALRKDVDLNPEHLMAIYDPQRNGTLSVREFSRLKTDITDPNAIDSAKNMRTLLDRTAANERAVAELAVQLQRIEDLLLGQGRGSSADAPTAPRASPNTKLAPLSARPDGEA